MASNFTGQKKREKICYDKQKQTTRQNRENKITKQ